MGRIRQLAAVSAAVWVLGAADAGAAPSPAAGETIYVERCAVCHMPTGHGQAGVYPPISDTLGHFMATESGRQYLANVLIYGLGGIITVDGTTYIGQMQVVPPLTDQEAADVLSYVLTALNSASLPADAKLLDAADMAVRREDGKAPTAVAKFRQSVMRELAAMGLSR
jgi:mono/diheme cytochrome c family protein